jgi:hypothetical protein
MNLFTIESSMDLHELGPWNLACIDPSKDLWAVRSSHGLLIAQVFGRGNARLTAQSPQLTEQLRASLAFVEAHTQLGPKEPPPCWAVLPNGTLDVEIIARNGRQVLKAAHP